MKANWLRPRSRLFGQRERGTRHLILKQMDSIHQDVEIQDITDASQQAASLYGGIPTAPQRSMPPTFDRADALPSPAPKTSSDRAEHWSPSVQNLLDRPPAAFPRQVMLGGIAFVLICGTWAWFGKINEISHARGELMHQGNVYKLHSIESGKIAHLAVKEGDLIKTGQVLAELDTELAQTEIERLKEQIAAFEMQLVQTQGAIEQKRTESRTLEAIAHSEIQAHNAVIARADENTRTVQSLIDRLHEDITESDNRRQHLTVEDEIAPELLEQLQAEIKANQARVERLQPLVERGAISQDFIFQAERDLRNSQNTLLRTQMSERDNQTVDSERLFDAEQSKRDRQSRLTEYQGQLEQAAAEREQLLAQLDSKKAEAEKNQIDIQEQTQQLELELTQIQARLTETRNLLEAAQIKLDRRFLYAPTDGIVLSLHADRSGEVVQPGQTLAEIAPTSAPLVLAANLPEREAGFVEVGMPVQIKFDAYPYQEYGLISGNVNSISPSTKPKEQLGEVYEVEITLEQNYVTENGEKIYFKPGQTANAEIVVRQRRILDVVLDPIRQLKEGSTNF